MKEIKFRAWDKKDKHWVSDAWVKTHIGLYDQYPELIFMQYTGLLDKNGMPIYEGDIVKILMYQGDLKYEPEIFTIEWIEKDLGFGARDIIDKDTWGLGDNDIEIIGDIHENPELLEEG